MMAMMIKMVMVMMMTMDEDGDDGAVDDNDDDGDDANEDEDEDGDEDGQWQLMDLGSSRGNSWTFKVVAVGQQQQQSWLLDTNDVSCQCVMYMYVTSANFR